MTAAAPVASLADYKKRVAGLDPDRFIGSILWFSISGTVVYDNGVRRTEPVRVTHEQLEQWYEEIDLDKRFLPDRIKKVDAFRKATSEAKREWEVTHESEWVATCPKCKADYTFGSNEPTHEYRCETDNRKLTPVEERRDVEGVTAQLMVREVTYDNERVRRHIVKEIRDRKGQKLSYEPHIATLQFYRGSKRTRGTANSGEKWTGKILPSVGGEDRKHAESMLEQITERYNDLSTNLQADAIRAMIRNYVTELNAISVKPSGGVYFTHNSRQTTVDGLQQLVSRIGQGCTFHQLPLIDTNDQREMLTEAYQSEVEDDVRRLIQDMAQQNETDKQKGRKVSTKHFAEFSARYQSIVERSEEYTRILGLAQGRSASALEMAMDAVMDLADRTE